MKKQMLPVIQGLWVGTALSTMEQLSIASFLFNGHPYHLYVYDEIKKVPPGAELRDANEIIDQSMIFKYRDRDTYAGFANLFRYKLLYDRGGYWADLDMICLRPFDFQSAYVFSLELSKTGSDIGSCVIRAPAGTALMRYCFETLMDRGDLENMKWGESGPLFFREQVRQFDLQRYAAEPGVFCPVAYNQVDDFISKSMSEILSRVQVKVRGVHLWSEMWRLSGFAKDAHYPEKCFYEALKLKLLSL